MSAANWGAIVLWLCAEYPVLGGEVVTPENAVWATIIAAASLAGIVALSVETKKLQRDETPSVPPPPRDTRPQIIGVQRTVQTFDELKAGGFGLFVDILVKEKTAFGDEWRADLEWRTGRKWLNCPGTVAQDHLLRGRQLLYRRDREGLLGSVVELRAAVRTDSNYAAAYAALASAYGLANAYFVAPPDSAYNWTARGLAAANRAVTLDSTNAEAFAARGYIETFNAAPPAEAEQDLRRAIALKPSYAEAHGWLGQLLAANRRVAEGLQSVDRAQELDPVSPAMRVAKISAAFLADSAELVVDQTRRLRALRPDIDILWNFEGVSLAALGRGAECIALERVTQSVRALCLRVVGRETEAAAQARASQARTAAGRMDLDLSFLPYYYVWSRQTPEAIRAVEWAFARAPNITHARPSGLHRLWGPDPGLNGGTFFSTVKQLRTTAWNRVVAESRTVALP
jgi:tetratricopeptide (TPR) repeat protein